MDDFQDDIRSFNVFGGNFTDVQGDHYHIRGNFVQHELESGRGIDKLGQVVSLSAIHDSSERYPPPRCHPETRTHVRALIICWIEDPNPTCFVLWLYGPAGAGKSAIMQSIAEECCSLLEGRFGASFFFSRGKRGRDQGHFLFSTIAYQLALNLPYLRKPIDNAVQLNPSLYTKSMMVQMRSLIIDSFRKLSSSVDHTPTVIIDGLDECDGHETQQLILDIIYEAVAIHKIPLRFLIASRPEAHIREAFDQPTLRNITTRIVLDEYFGPNRDIAKYLRHGFESIYQKNQRLMEQVVYPWPGTGIIDLLVQKASGQFIYASTVLKFVGAEFYNPISQLDIVLEPFPKHGTPFSELDRLYTQILSTYPVPERLIQVLGTILALHGPQPLEVIGDFLGMKPGEVGLVLRGLHSLIKFPLIRGENSKIPQSRLFDDEAGVQFFHASFREYLVDEARSAHFFIDTDKFYAQVTKSGFELIAKGISNPWGFDATTCCPHPETWNYLKFFLSLHYTTSSENLRDAIVQILLACAETFWMRRDSHSTSQVNYEPLHYAMTILAYMMFKDTKERDGISRPDLPDYSEMAYDCTLNRIQQDRSLDKPADKRLAVVFSKYREILDISYHLLLSESRDMEELIQFAPAFLIIQAPLCIPDVARLLDIDENSFLGLLEKNRYFVDFIPNSCGPPGVLLNIHFRKFLCDYTRSTSHYRDPRPLHNSICLRYYKLAFDHSWSDTKRLLQGFQLREHLDAIHIEVSEEILADHPIWSFLDHLQRIDNYLPAFDRDHDQVLWVWSLIADTLCWIEQHQNLFRLSDVHHDLQHELRNVTDRIYSQILCVDGSTENAVVTLWPPFLGALEYRMRRVSFEALAPAFPVTVSEIYYFDDPTVKATGVSYDFLLLEHLNPSLIEFLTSQSRAKNLYVDADTYYTQMAEFCLESFIILLYGKNWDNLREIDKLREKLARAQCKFHLERARPSQQIFARLRLLSFQSLLITATLGPPRDSIRVLITWLESLPAPPVDIYLLYQTLLLLAEEDERDANNATEASAQSPSKNILGYLQDYVATSVGWLLNT